MPQGFKNRFTSQFPRGVRRRYCILIAGRPDPDHTGARMFSLRYLPWL